MIYISLYLNIPLVDTEAFWACVNRSRLLEKKYFDLDLGTRVQNRAKWNFDASHSTVYRIRHLAKDEVLSGEGVERVLGGSTLTEHIAAAVQLTQC